ncbi:hypothetical protein [Mannheimia indoligenes]|uniref:Uncharacterized protein n=1 Tax=Mannheimia indoligenes TaxID=3103145 RepID=A0ABU7ZCV1_9PAST
MSKLGIILNPALYEAYHCAILSAEQDQGISHFSLAQINQFLGLEAKDFGDICHYLISYWGDIGRLDGIEISCRLELENQKRMLYLIFDNNLERLETRVTRLGYLLNQRAILILPCGGKKLRRYLLNTDKLIFSPKYKEREYSEIYEAIYYYFRYIYQKTILSRVEYKENCRFCDSGIMNKSGMHLLGQKMDKHFTQIKIGQRFEIKEEN